MKKKGTFIIELEFYSSGMVGYYSEKVFGSWFSLKEECATKFANERIAKYYVLNLARHHYDIRMFNIKKIK